MSEMSLKRAWERYRKSCISPDASELQLSETKRAFYGGATWLMAFLKTDHNVSEDEEMEMLAGLGVEMQEYYEEQKRAAEEWRLRN